MEHLIFSFIKCVHCMLSIYSHILTMLNKMCDCDSIVLSFWGSSTRSELETDFFVGSFIYSVQQRLWTLPGLKYMRMSTESKDLSVGSKMPKMCRWVNCPVIEIDHQFCNKHFFACLWHASRFVL